MKRAYVLAIITLIPIALTSFIWLDVIHGVAPRAIDGSGHFAIAQIYDQTIFPDTFGWTNAYFGGMSFPNFYPPLFFWLVSLLHHTGLVSFATAFKLVVAVPLIMMPLVFWAVAYVHTNKNAAIAFGVAIAGVTLCSLGEVFQPNTGLDMSSTLLDGFYTQPLGFVLLLSWILVYLLPRQRTWQFVAAAILLALTVLANFFNAIAAVFFVASVLICDVAGWIRTPAERELHRNSFLVHFLSPWLALALSAFWLAPMLSSYEYLVTRPVVRPLSRMITTPLWCWYFLAITGAVIWLRRSTGRLKPYLIACFVLLVALIFSGRLAPAWFPLQVFRFFSTVNFLFCLPVGISLAYVAQLYFEKRTDWSSPKTATTNRVRWIVFVAYCAVFVILLALAMSSKKLTKSFAFYTPETYPRIAGALEFAKSHKDGLYLVEVLRSFADSGLVRSDSLALNAYLGAQGNETISIVYREASPNSPFFNAELNALSPYRENFGISSALMSDLDFINQPLAQHIKRLQFMGVHYLVIGSPKMKERLSHEAEVAARYDVDEWTIYELRQPAAPRFRTLQYQPALVVSDFTVKMRRRNQYDYMRLAEEQFKDAWFDVLLARSRERRIDLLPQLDQFGALILDTYDYQDENKALDQLKNFAQTRALILLSSDAPLFTRIKSELDQFPHAVVIDRPAETPGEWIATEDPSEHYDASSIRTTWKSIREALDREKVAVSSVAQVSEDDGGLRIIPYVSAEGQSAPLLIATTFHPKWLRSDGEPLYAATPFYTVGFFDHPSRISFQRTTYDRAALWFSFGALVFLGILLGVAMIRRREL